MSQNPRCLYNNSFAAFLRDSAMSILGTLCDNYHGEARTTTREAWKAEIDIMQEVLSQCDDRDGYIVFEYAFMAAFNEFDELFKRLHI